MPEVASKRSLTQRMSETIRSPTPRGVNPLFPQVYYMRLYISGPMRGIPEFNRPKFDEVAKRIRRSGHTAISPLEIDTAVAMDDWGCRAVPEDVARHTIMRDLVLIAYDVDGIVVLPGWKDSRGAKAEVELARCFGLHIFNEWGNLI